MSTVLIGGGTGLIGMRLSRWLARAGYTVLHLSRTPDPDAPFPAYGWNIREGTIDQEAVERADAVINLAGAGIADRRWSPSRKALIIKSRTATARLLQEAMARSASRPAVYLSAGAIGYYGDRGETLLEETDEPGKGFLSESCLAWEGAARAVSELGVRTVLTRTGIVLSTRGGALAKMMPPVHFYLAPYFGTGRQWYSWIHVDDLCRIYQFALERDDLQGTFNAVAPNPERNRAFMQQLAEAMGKKALSAPVPAAALRLIFGEMADTILDSTRVSADKLQDAGFEFQYPELSEALVNLIVEEK